MVYSHDQQEIVWSVLDDSACCDDGGENERGWQYREPGSQTWNPLAVSGSYLRWQWADIATLTVNTVYEIKGYFYDCLGVYGESASTYVIREE